MEIVNAAQEKIPHSRARDAVRDFFFIRQKNTIKENGV